MQNRLLFKTTKKLVIHQKKTMTFSSNTHSIKVEKNNKTRKLNSFVYLAAFCFPKVTPSDVLLFCFIVLWNLDGKLFLETSTYHYFYLNSSLFECLSSLPLGFNTRLHDLKLFSAASSSLAVLISFEIYELIVLEF